MFWWQDGSPICTAYIFYHLYICFLFNVNILPRYSWCTILYKFIHLYIRCTEEWFTTFKGYTPFIGIIKYWLHSPSYWAFVVAQTVKNLPSLQETGLIPGLGRFPGGGHGHPFQYKFKGYTPFMVIIKYWLYSPSYTIQYTTVAYFIPNSFYL